MPRRVSFDPPGVRISAAEQPRLMAAVDQVAHNTGQALPAETYVTLEVNAAVTEVPNGFLRGRRRVLIIGLPLLQIVSERGFRGVLAHEFGHYAGGDTRLGPWIWRTRETIDRTIERLTDHEEDSWSQRAVRTPFVWYGKAFMRITSAISRRQELAADVIAARQVGRDAHVEALRRVHALAPGFDTYWTEEVVPVLASGRRPPLLAGFAGFVATEWARGAAAAQLEHVLAQDRADAYDSHPALAERIAAVAGCPAGMPDDSLPAHAMIEQTDVLEARALELLSHGEVGDRLPRVDWADTAEVIWLPGCRDAVARHRAALAGVTVGDIGEHVAGADRDARRPFSAALVLAAVRAGWRPEALPGEPLSVVSGDERMVPLAVLAALADGDLAPDAWRERATALGIAGEPLVLPEPEPAIS